MDPRDLYGLPLDRFVAERGALVKALRGEGRKEEAARVAALRKPSVAAWTVNQLVRTQRSPVAALLAAGDALRRVQSELLAGRGDARALRGASRRERDAVAELTEAARGLLNSEGHEPTPATLDRVSETLHAAALDEDVRAQVREGCLERELRRVGFGASGAMSAQPSTGAGGGRSRASGGAATPTASAPPAGGAPPAMTSARDRKPEAEPARGGPADRDRAERDRAERERVERERAKRERVERERVERERVERERVERLESARKAEAGARRVAERAARELQAAQERRDRASDALSAADAALVATRERAEEAALAYLRAHDELEGLG